MHHLTKKDVPFEWTDETEAAFQSLKKALIEPVMVDVVTKKTCGRKWRVARRKRRDKAIMAELPQLWDIDEVAVATRANPTLEKLLAWKSRPQWEQIVKEGPELIKLYWQHWNLWWTDARELIWYRWVVDKTTHQWRLVIPDVY